MTTETAPQTSKEYRCKRCGHTMRITTNHYGECYSLGHFNCCPACPPYAKYPEFGGSTTWECIEPRTQQSTPAPVAPVEALDWSDACERTVQDWRAGRERRAYEITEEAYWWGLGCVPPALMKSSAYLCGEPYTDNAEGQPLYSAAVQTGGRFYALGLMTVNELRAFTPAALGAAIALRNK